MVPSPLVIFFVFPLLILSVSVCQVSLVTVQDVGARAGEGRERKSSFPICIVLSQYTIVI
jgi:hypothetical protein